MNPLYLTNVGVQTSFGGIRDSAAAYRCSLSMMTELDNWPYFDSEQKDEQFIVGFPAAGLYKGFDSIARYLKLFKVGLEDFGRGFVENECSQPIDGMYLLLRDESTFEQFPDFHNKFRVLAEEVLEAKFQSTQSFHVFSGETTDISEVIAQAKKDLCDAKCHHIIVGVVDSLLESNAMQTLIDKDMIKTMDNVNGKMPGEAAVFLSLSITKNNNEAVIIKKISPSEIEVNSTDNLLEKKITGDVLTKVILDSLTDISDEDLEQGTIYSDFSGDPVDSHELSNALLRASTSKPVSHWFKEFPATSFGDVGVSSMLLHIAFAYQAFTRGYHLGRCSLILSQADSLKRSALLLEKI